MVQTIIKGIRQNICDIFVLNCCVSVNYCNVCLWWWTFNKMIKNWTILTQCANYKEMFRFKSQIKVSFSVKFFCISAPCFVYFAFAFISNEMKMTRVWRVGGHRVEMFCWGIVLRRCIETLWRDVVLRLCVVFCRYIV